VGSRHWLRTCASRLLSGTDDMSGYNAAWMDSVNYHKAWEGNMRT
jgi:hypothetical protein